MNRNVWFAIAAALFFTICFHRTTFVDFERIRETILFNQQGPEIPIDIPRDPRAPILLLEIKNLSSTEISIRLAPSSGGAETIILEAGEKSILYREPKRFIRLVSNTKDWELRRVELRNYYGSRRDLLRYTIVPSQSRVHEAPSLWWLPVLFALLFVFGWLAPSLTRGRRILWAAVLIFWVVIVLLPFFTPYKVLFGVKTFCLFLALLFLPGIRAAYRALRREAEQRWEAKGVSWLHSIIVGVAVFLFFVFEMLFSLQEFRGNYSGFLVLAPKFVYNNPLLMDREDIIDDLIIAPGEGGYDGQFFYAMAFDPFLREFPNRPRLYRKVVDAPPYRYSRIGYSILAKIFSLDRPEFFPQAMIFLILASHLVASLFLARLAVYYGRSPFWALLYLLIPAFTVSLRVALPESLAAAFLIGGIYFRVRDRLILAAGFFAAAILVRETSAVLVLCAIGVEVFRKRFKPAALLSLSMIPYIAWRIYLAFRLFPLSKWKALFYDPEGTKLPFAGLGTLFQKIYGGEYYPDAVNSAILFTIFLVFLFFFSILLLRKRKDFITIAFFIYALLAVSLDYEHVLVAILNAERVSYEAFLLFLLAFITMKSSGVLERVVPILFFIVLLIYDWSIFSYSHFFRAGLLWGN